MKKSILIFIILPLFLIHSPFKMLSQNVEDNINAKKEKLKQAKNDRLMWGIYTDIWQKAPDSLNIKSVNQGGNIQAMVDYHLFGNFSIGIGIGISSHNLYSSCWIIPERDTTSKLTGKTIFYKIPDTINFKKNKLSVTYLDLPIELRFRGKNSESAKVALGFKGGLTINNHTKYKGDEYIYGDRTTIKEKKYDNSNILNYRYGITGRIGYKWINLNIFYSLTNLFKNNKAPEMYPVSIGIMITPF